MSSPSRAMAIASMALAAGLTFPAPGATVQAGKATAAKLPAPATAPARQALSTTALCSRVNIAPAVLIPVGKSTVLRPSSPVTRILLGNPENARAARPAETPDGKKDEGVKTPAINTRPGVADVDVLLLAPTEVYLLGKTIGTTNVVMLDRDGTCTAFDVVVAMDTMALQAVIGQLLPIEKEVKVTSAFDSIVLSGMVSDTEALTRVTDLANAYVRGQDGGGQSNQRVVNMLEVGAPQQVMLEVKVAEISKSLLDQFGINFSRAYVPGDGSMMRFLSGIFGGAAGVMGQISNTGPNGVPFSSVDAVIGGTVPIAGASGGNVTVTYDATTGRPTYTTSYGTVPGRGVSNTTLNMQKNDGLVKVLAEPTIMAISGQTGSFLAGGKIFIPVSKDNASGGSTTTLEEKEFGVSVRFTPTVLGSGRINLRVRPEVSELNVAGVQISSGGLNAVLPSFTSRKAETTVQLMDGQSFAIGGLIKNNTTTNISAFPFLGELPVVGALFRSTEFQTDRSELVFVITARLVKPLPVGYRLPTDGYVPPSRSELILGGKLEGQRTDDAASGDNPAQGGFDKEKK
ncbi:type II and III secretion system protein family protein [Rhodoferax ferrireducens]|uniref:type II and III secretion system protein family protein n=1 Tax=Rhodoferax ferrireducens TaxID=192843 RepID=UPI003BB5684A